MDLVMIYLRVLVSGLIEVKRKKCSRTHGMDYLANLTCSTTHLLYYNNIKDVLVFDVASNYIENPKRRCGHICTGRARNTNHRQNHSCMSSDSARSFNEDHGWVHVYCRIRSLRMRQSRPSDKAIRLQFMEASCHMACGEACSS